MPTVDSTVIARIEYDARLRELSVTFASGATYRYYGVPPTVYESFLTASSKGAFFNAYVRDRYDFALTRGGTAFSASDATAHRG